MKQIKLSQGQIAIVDDCDFEFLNQFKWLADNKKCTFYALRIVKGKVYRNIYMHRELLGINNPKISVDHIDRNGLNNQRSNLRACTQSENIRNSKLSKTNTSGFKGVYRHRGSNKFMAYIRHNYKMYNLGLFKTAEDAAIARNNKAVELHGKFAYINKI